MGNYKKIFTHGYDNGVMSGGEYTNYVRKASAVIKVKNSKGRCLVLS